MIYYFDWTDLNGPVYFITFIWRTSTDLYILFPSFGGPQRTSMFSYFDWTDLNGPVYVIDFIGRTSTDLYVLLL
jgi:hypothetical protein